MKNEKAFNELTEEIADFNVEIKQEYSPRMGSIKKLLKMVSGWKFEPLKCLVSSAFPKVDAKGNLKPTDVKRLADKFAQVFILNKLLNDKYDIASYLKTTYDITIDSEFEFTKKINVEKVNALWLEIFNQPYKSGSFDNQFLEIYERSMEVDGDIRKTNEEKTLKIEEAEKECDASKKAINMAAGVKTAKKLDQDPSDKIQKIIDSAKEMNDTVEAIDI